jgi:hypothetical protein
MQSFTGVALSTSAVGEDSSLDTLDQSLVLPLHQCYAEGHDSCSFCDEMSDDERTYLVNYTRHVVRPVSTSTGQTFLVQTMILTTILKGTVGQHISPQDCTI